MKSLKLFGSSKEDEPNKTKKCHACLVEIPEKATKCSHCSTKQRVKFTKGHAVLFGIITIFFIIIFSSGGGDTANESIAPEITDSKVHIVAQNYVEAVLKSPSTADFPMLDYHYFDLGNDKHKVSSYVDSQNGFGAEVRSEYSVVLSYDGGEWADASNWTLSELVVDGEILYSETIEE